LPLTPKSDALSSVATTPAGRITPPNEEKEKRKSVNKGTDVKNGLEPDVADGDIDLSKKPKKTLIEVIDEAILAGEEAGLPICVGELKAMKNVVDATSGKPKMVELERVVYVTYWRRLKEINAYIKRSQKKKKMKINSVANNKLNY